MDSDYRRGRVRNGLVLVATRPLMRGRGMRRVCSSAEVAAEITMPVADVNRVGRKAGRLYFDVGDRQVRATYEGAGRWRINTRARYW